MTEENLSYRPLYQHVAIRVAEYLREAAVLIVVFSILDKIVFGHDLEAVFVLAVMVISFGFLGFGIALERRFGR
jgi:hypothetical protein